MKNNKGSNKPIWQHFLKWLISFLSSIKLTIPLLFLITIASIIGTIIPQNMSHEIYIREYGHSFASLMERLGLFNMYHSHLFISLLTLLMINLIICSLKRWKTDWNIAKKRWKPGYDSKNLKLICETNFNASPEIVMGRLKDIFKVFKTTNEEVIDDNKVWWSGERGHWSRLSFYFVHFSILIILIGSVLSLGFGDKGFMTIEEGKTEESFEIRGQEELEPLGFKIRCNKFKIEFHENGMPSEYTSDITIIENNKEVLDRAIMVNAPLKFNGINFYQNSYGSTLNTATLDVVDRETGESHKITCKPGQDIKLPIGDGLIRVLAYTDNFEGLGAALRITIKRPEEKPESFIIFKDIPEFDIKHRKDTITFRIKDVNTGYYTVLEVKKDPGVPVVYVGFLMFIFSLFLVFYFSHQKLAIYIIPSKNGSNAKIYGSAHKSRLIYIQNIRERIKKVSI